MSILTRTILLFILAVDPTSTASAQSIPIDRLRDWEFRFYACKHVTLFSAYILRVMKEHDITGEEGLGKLERELGPALSSTLSINERKYQFSAAEALFVSDLTFAVVSGMTAGGEELTDIGIISSASDLCVRVIEGMSQ